MHAGVTIITQESDWQNAYKFESIEPRKGIQESDWQMHTNMNH